MVREFLFGKGRVLFVSVLESDRLVTGIRDWPTAVNWLLRIYGTDDNVNRAVEQLMSAQQKPEENELEFFNKFTKLHMLCGSHQPQAMLRTLFLMAWIL